MTAKAGLAMGLVALLLITVSLVLRLAAGQKETMENVVIDVREPAGSPGQPPKLAPALAATKSTSGILVGADSRGRPVISIASDAFTTLKADPLVKSFTKELPPGWAPVTRLKISYSDGQEPSPTQLKVLGLKVVENYAKGKFMLVEPVGGKISAKLISALEREPKIRHVSPVFRVNAIQ